MELFCFPFAGGTKYSYRSYEQIAPPSIIISPIEYPGRGSRMRDALLTDMESLIDDIFNQLKQRLTGQPYAIYGHSMGGLVAYLITKRLLNEGYPPPVHVFITGTTGPSSIERERKARHLMSKKDFIQEIVDLNGMPDEILHNDEMMEYFEPILRADFAITEKYRHLPAAPLNIPFTVITGTDEDMEEESILLWQEVSAYPVDFRKLTGKHFFIFDHTDEILEIIRSKFNNTDKVFQL